MTKIKSAVSFANTPASSATTWSASSAVSQLRTWAGVDVDDPPASAWRKYRRGFARVVGEGNTFGDFSFPHHTVSNGELQVNLRALSAGIAVVNGGRGSVSWESEAERRAVYNHLIRHYAVFPDNDPPELRERSAIMDDTQLLEINARLLEAIRARGTKQTEFGYGIMTADRHVGNLRDEVGLQQCYRHFAGKGGISFGDAMEKARETLVYSNSQMTVSNGVKILSDIKSTTDLEFPKNTLVAFRHVLTTPKKDRDGDVLRSEGAEVDPDMLLLWQHVHTLPIGKMIGVYEQNAERLSMISVIVDMNQLSHDAAVMVDNGMGRFSHGFRAIEYTDLKEDDGNGGTTSPGGFDIKRFEIMEASLVSVPSNTDAITEDILLGLLDGGKLKHPIVKQWGRQLKERRPLTASGVQFRERLGDYEKEIQVGNPDDLPGVLQAIKERDDDTADEPGSARTEKAGTPSETNGASQEGEERRGESSAGDTEVKRTTLDGSWEWIEKQLRSQVERFLELSGAVSMRDRFGWVAGTYADHVIACAEHFEAGIQDEFLYFRVPWAMDNEEPKLQGDVTPVEIVTTVEIRERSPGYSDKTQPRQQPEDPQTAKEAMAVFLAKANENELESLTGILAVMRETTAANEAAVAIGLVD